MPMHLLPWHERVSYGMARLFAGIRSVLQTLLFLFFPAPILRGLGVKEAWQPLPQPVQVILLDHGLYRDVGHAFRSNYCKLWRAMVLQDEQQLREVTIAPVPDARSRCCSAVPSHSCSVCAPR
jgi:hypothetical protein